MKVLVTGAARDENTGQFLRGTSIIGELETETIELAAKVGISLYGGNLRKTDKRVLTYAPTYPGCHKSGFALRTRIVWWLHTGEVLVGNKIDIHHKNHIRHDDRFNNLEKLDHVLHTKHHNPRTAPLTTCICQSCSKPFMIKIHRLKEAGRGNYCSQKCYQIAPKNKKDLINKTCLLCGSIFICSEFKAKHRKFCSKSCSATYSWRERCAY